jgi:hypothetical protein
LQPFKCCGKRSQQVQGAVQPILHEALREHGVTVGLDEKGL